VTLELKAQGPFHDASAASTDNARHPVRESGGVRVSENHRGVSDFPEEAVKNV
jgi:hypothetical protein